MKKTDKNREPVNMKVGVSKGILKITINLNDYLDNAELSASGNSYVIASSKGNNPLKAKGYEDIRLGVNAYIPKARFEELKRIQEIDKAGGRITSDLPSESQVVMQQQQQIDALTAQLAQVTELLTKLAK